MGKKSKRGEPRRAAVSGSAQGQIPFEELYENGLLRVRGETYALLFSMGNADYLVAREEQQEKKTELYAAIFNALPPDIHYQEVFMTVPVDRERLVRTVLPPGVLPESAFHEAYIQNQSDAMDAVTDNISDSVLHFVLSYERLNRLDDPYRILMSCYAGIQQNLETIGAESAPLSPEGVLEVFHRLYNPYREGEFRLPDDLFAQGLTIKDYIAPSHFDFKARQVEMGAAMGRVFLAKSYGSVLDDALVKDLLDTSYRVTVVKHVDHVDQGEAMRFLEGELKRLEMNRQTRKANNAKNGTDYIPYYLQRTAGALTETMDSIDKEGQQLFSVSVYVLAAAQDEEELRDVCKIVQGIAMRHRVELQQVSARLGEAMVSVAPVGHDRLGFTKSLLSDAVGVLHPFSYRRLYDARGYFYGVNTLSRTPIIYDRKRSLNSNAFILGMSGSGKSFYAKLEIIDTRMLMPEDQILVIDPEAEFVPLCDALGGQVFDLRPGSGSFINPFDLSAFQGDEDPLEKKRFLILALMESFKRAPLTAQEASILNRCVLEVYKPYLASGDPADIPTFHEFAAVLARQPEEERRDLLLYLETYITGNVDIFAHRTNTDMNNRFIVFKLDGLSADLKAAGMLFLMDFVWQRTMHNKAADGYTWIYADEFHLYYASDECRKLFESVFMRARKYGGLATAMTPNVAHVVASESGQQMLDNSCLTVLLLQRATNLTAAVKQFDLSPALAARLRAPQPGEGVLVIDGVPHPFARRYPTDNPVYQTITTKPRDAGAWGRRQETAEDAEEVTAS